MKLPKMYASVKEKKTIDMTLSTNPLGCSPRAINALKNITVRDISSYEHGTDLVKKLAQRFKVRQNMITVGNGSEQIIKLIAQTFLCAGNSVLIQEGSFAVFTKECTLKGANIKFINPKRQKTMRVSASLIFLCNPNNPTGEILPADFIRNIVRTNPKTIVVVDEANGEFMNSSGIPLTKTCRNLIILRTLSKAIGLAGLRVGCAIGPVRFIKRLNNEQQVFPISAISSKLACAAIGDRKFLNKTKKFVVRERERIKKTCLQIGLTPSNSVTNNLFIMSPDADMIISELSDLGVGVIPGNSFPNIKEKGFRIAIKSIKTNNKFLKALTQAVSCVRNKNLVR